MPKSAGLLLRWLSPPDLPAIEALLVANQPVFSDEECRVALEMIREALHKPDSDHPYQFLIAEATGKAVGFAGFGSIPLTERAYDLYWVAVHPAYQGCGVGRALLLGCEGEVLRQSGRVLVVETSSREEYGRARRCYEATDYRPVARIKDYYRPGDDKITYVKYLSCRGAGLGA